MIVPEKVLEILMIKYFREDGDKKLTTDAEYAIFSEEVKKKTAKTKALHINTWKRVFRRLTKKDGSPCESSSETCEMIAEYLQCESWEELMDNLDKVYEIQKRRGGVNEVSEIFTPTSIDNLISSLRRGDIIEVKYYPDRLLQLEFIKGGCYKIISSYKSTKLLQGDIIYIEMFIVNQPLIIPQVIRNGINKGRYQSAKGHNIQSVKCISRRASYDI